MPLIPVNDTELYYELTGSGEQTVVLLNGISMSTAAWTLQEPVLAQHYRVLRYDLRGQLQSGKPDNDIYGMPQHAVDLACLLERLGIGRAHLVGLSYGGAVAQHFALDYPQCLSKLLLASTMAWSDPVNAAIADSWEAAARSADPTLRFDIGLPLTFGAAYLQQQGERIRQLREFVSKQPWLPMARLMNGMRAHDVRSRLGQVVAPTLVLVGEDDRFTPLYHARLLADLIPGAQLQVVPDCGHALPLEAPQRFNQLLLDFLASKS